MCSNQLSGFRQNESQVRVATAQGKQGIWFLLFPDRENTGNFVVTQGKFLRHRENIFDCIYYCKSILPITYFQFFLALLGSAYFLVSDDCFLYNFYQYISALLSFYVTLVTSISQTYFGSFKNKLKQCNLEYEHPRIF